MVEQQTRRAQGKPNATKERERERERERAREKERDPPTEKGDEAPQQESAYKRGSWSA
jgi:hypothetical protein